MSVKIQIKRGLKADLPNLEDGEFGLCTDSGDLIIGNGGSNLNVITEENIQDYITVVEIDGGTF